MKEKLKIVIANKPAITEQNIKKIKGLKKALAYAEAIISTVREPLVVLYPGFKIKTASKSFYKTFKVQRNNTEGEITYCNKKAEVIFGKKVKDIIGKNILKIFSDTGAIDFQKQYLKIVATGGPAIFEEYYHPLKIWLQVRAFPSKTGMSVYLDDISKRKQAEKHLEELFRQKDEFIGIASHELNTPVTSIKGY